MLEVPRSARLAAWGTAALRREVDVERAVRAVLLDDEPHAVHGAATGLPDADTLVGLLEGWREAGVRGLAVVLPAPGDALGLPGPPEFNARALAAGECVLTAEVVDGAQPTPQRLRSAGLVPEVIAFGSELEPGHLVTWEVSDVAGRRPALTGAAEADRELRLALREATEVLDAVAGARADPAASLAPLRRGSPAEVALPPTAPARSVHLLTTAVRVRAIVAAADGGDAQPLSAYDGRRREDALRALEGVCRRALAAAVNGLLEPARPGQEPSTRR